MNIELIKSELDRLSLIIRSWEEGETVSAIERDMALDKLKNIYDILRFGALVPQTHETGAAPAVAETVPAAGESVTDDAVNNDEAAATDMPQANAGYENTEDEDAGDVEVEFIFAEDDDAEANEQAAGYDRPEEPGNTGSAAPAAEEQAEEEPVVEEPAIEKPVTEEPTVEEPAAAEPAPEKMTEPEAAAEPAGEMTPEPESATEIPAAEPSEQVAATGHEEIAGTAPSAAAPEIPAEQPVVTEAEPAAATEPVQPVQPAAEKPESDSAPQPARRPMNSLFGADDEIQSRPRTKHHRMMSIYNDAQPRPEKVVDISKIFETDIDEPMFGHNSEIGRPASEPERTVTKEERAQKPVRETVTETPRRETAVKPAVTTHHAAEQQSVTLGDTIGANTQTLADTLGKPAALAEEITHTKIDSLRQAIGINDKFLMIRDLFDGDGEAYEEAIGVLDSFDSLDDCMIHIVENYAWNPDSQGAKFIMQLLERKLS